MILIQCLLLTAKLLMKQWSDLHAAMAVRYRVRFLDRHPALAKANDGEQDQDENRTENEVNSSAIAQEHPKDASNGLSVLESRWGVHADCMKVV